MNCAAWLKSHLGSLLAGGTLLVVLAVSGIAKWETIRSGDSGPSSEARTVASVTVRVLLGGTQRQSTAWGQLLRVFERTHPDIDIEFVPTIPGQTYQAQVQTAMLGGHCADLMFFENEPFPNFAVDGAFLDLTPFIEREAYDLSDFFPVTLEEFTYDGRLYGLPQGGGPIVIFYNADLFEEFGVEYSDDWYWDDFVEAARRLTVDRNGDGRIDIYGYQGKREITHALIPVWSSGGSALSEDRRSWHFNTPTNLVAFTWWAELWTKHGIQAHPSASREGADAGLSIPFVEGWVAMEESGPYFAKYLRQHTKFRWAIGYHPKSPVTGKRVTRYYGDGYVAWAKTEHPEEVWELLKFLAGPVGMRMIARTSRSIPARISVARSSAFNRADTPWDESRLVDAMDWARRQPITEYFGEFDRICTKYIGRLFSFEGRSLFETMSPEEVLAAIDLELNAYAEGWWRRRDRANRER